MVLILAGEVIVSPGILLLLVFIVAAGQVMVHFIANHKWGYTKKREKELEEADFSRKAPRQAEYVKKVCAILWKYGKIR